MLSCACASGARAAADRHAADSRWERRRRCPDDAVSASMDLGPECGSSSACARTGRWLRHAALAQHEGHGSLRAASPARQLAAGRDGVGAERARLRRASARERGDEGDGQGGVARAEGSGVMDAKRTPAGVVRRRRRGRGMISTTDAGERTVRTGHADVAVPDVAAGARRVGAVPGDDAHRRVHRRIPRRDPRAARRPSTQRSASSDEARAEVERLRAELADHHTASVLRERRRAARDRGGARVHNTGAQGFAGMARRQRDAAVAAEREACAVLCDAIGDAAETERDALRRSLALAARRADARGR